MSSERGAGYILGSNMIDSHKSLHPEWRFALLLRLARLKDRASPSPGPLRLRSPLPRYVTPRLSVAAFNRADF